jgi:polyisoprenoid-binding protein YceI
MTTPDQRVTLGPDNARMLIRTNREGFAARAGHDLTIEVTRWSAELDMPAGQPADAKVTAEVHLDSLAVREGTGGIKPLTDADRQEIAGTARGLLSERGEPVASFASTRVTPAGRGGSIEGEVTMYGMTTPMRLQIHERGKGRYTANTSVRQSAFGLKPYTAFLGALKLRDEVAVEITFELSGPATPQ